ncbi:MAG: DUF2079 domain-containing protein [Deltaproteobacteria bacterium]|nr:DUF2079 domain-containing protein [Deltaproteobacteria bacterium]
MSQASSSPPRAADRAARVAGLAWGASAGLLLALGVGLCSYGLTLDLARIGAAPDLPARAAVLDVLGLAGAVAGALAGALGVRVERLRLAAAAGLVLVVLRALFGAPTALGLTLAAAALAVLAARLLGTRWHGARARTSQRGHLAAACATALLAFVLYAVWSVTRHLRFGSGSWDLGCYNHNAWLFAHGKPWVSSVLGDASFWGGTNHFMPSLALTAPLAWWMEATGTSSALLYAQAACIAATAFPLAALARRYGLGPLTTLGLCAAVLFSVGTQSAANFDVHEIIPVPLCLLLALWAVETGRRWLLYPALVVLIGTKESAILYGGAFGAFLVLFRAQYRREGIAIAVACAAWFYVVTAVIQPAQLEPGARMIHVLRFRAFGESTIEATLGMLLHPGRALLALLSPLEKTQTLAVTAGTFGFLPLASPEGLVLALPNLAERFLSDKREMWGLGFHYGWPTVGFFSVGALFTLARLWAAAARRLTARGASAIEGRLDVAGGALLLALTLAVPPLASPTGFELASLEKRYFASAEQVARYRRALALIPDDAAVVAQNHFLPHLALREHVWQPEERFVERADWIVLDPAASPWPHSARHVAQLVASLRADPRFTVAFEEGSTLVFRRR